MSRKLAKTKLHMKFEMIIEPTLNGEMDTSEV